MVDSMADVMTDTMDNLLAVMMIDSMAFPLDTKMDDPMTAMIVDEMPDCCLT